MISVEVYDVKYIILLMAGAYLLGNISPAYLLAKKQKKVDIRDVGSGNAGTTNALRFMGKKAALFVFLVDFFKGILASYIGYRLGGLDMGYLCGISVIIGHVFPVLLKFKGGKGVATSIGAMIVLEPMMVLISVAVGVLFIAKFRYVSLGAIVGIMMFPAQMVFHGETGISMVISVLLWLFILYTHRTNISRLMCGEERKLGEKL
ncbi:glycerol-3-phosphate 1-O-acyltransferase PlsY [Filifactor alocis]|uniref:glycerol-3-phosphate 1-O-acyltransferase PlsY n=1 Tax=Filifactor alocis TaxID=143361 RepID=UPI0028EBE5DB|nr:glycerol-3-phosphate 1-O-acyltransferase PlsY [Filifactor alocis]